MADTGAPLSLPLLEVGQSGKEAVYNAAMALINTASGGAGMTVTWTGDISPTQIAANTDNYNPTGLSTAAVLRLNTDASRNLTGIAGGTDGRILLLLNIGSFPLVLIDDATSTAANRFQLSGDITLNAGEGIALWYDSTSSRWRTWSQTWVPTARTISTTAPVTGGGDLSANRTIAVSAASTSASGVSELATNTETTTGTDTGRTITPDALAHSNYGIAVIGVLVTDPNGSALTTGDLKAYVRIPSTITGWNLVGVAAHVSTVSSSGVITVQIRNVTDAVDMLSTALTIDANEKDSATAATAAVINTSNDDVATADEIAIDIDGAGTGAKGLFVELRFQLP
jgi:hypothetical protein